MFLRPLLIRTKVLPYESLSSLVYRLANANFFDHGWKICRLIGVPGNLFRNQNLLSDHNIIKRLAFINNCSENEIFNTTVHRFAGCFSGDNNGVLSSDAIEKFFLSTSTRYCSLCLKESRYHKIHWELLPVTVCLKHKVLLQDFCPKCHRKVKIRWVLRNTCKCGANLLPVDTISVASCTEAIRNQIFIQNLLGINESGYLERVSWIKSTPAAELSPNDFLKLLKIFSMLISNKLPESSRFLKLDGLTAEPVYQIEMKNGISNFVNFVLTHSASSILLDWPQKFYDFLEDYSKMERSKRWKTGVEKYFGGLKERLFAKLDEEKFGFVYQAYCNYLNEYWTGGNLGNVKIFDTLGGKNLQKKHITQEEAAKVLDRDHHFVSKLIIQKLIKTVVHDAGSTKRYVIDSDSVY